MAMVALVFILLQVMVAIFAAQIAPFDPYKGDYAVTWQLPNREHCWAPTTWDAMC